MVMFHRLDGLVTTGIASVGEVRVTPLTGANAAEALRRRDVGIVEAGRREDLVLLSATPRASISNTRSIFLVMQSGRFESGGAAKP